MDLFAIAGAFWRHKLATIPVVFLTVLGMLYIVAVRPPTFEADANILLMNPPASPTAAQIYADPKLARVNTNNSLASIGNLVQVADVLIEVVSAPAAKQALVAAGANPNYQVTSDNSAQTPPAIDVIGEAPTPKAAINSTQLVATAIIRDLHEIQVRQHISNSYMISAMEYVKPTSASTSISSKLRTLIVVIAIGFILLLITVSTSQSLEERKKGSRKGRAQVDASNVNGTKALNGSAQTMTQATSSKQLSKR